MGCEIAEQTFCPKFGKITIANRDFADLHLANFLDSQMADTF
jgi:hypothetical protein